MIQRLAARAGGLDEDTQVVLNLLLADVFAQDLRAQREFDLLLVVHGDAADKTRFVRRYFLIRRHHNCFLHRSRPTRRTSSSHLSSRCITCASSSCNENWNGASLRGVTGGAKAGSLIQAEIAINPRNSGPIG